MEGKTVTEQGLQNEIIERIKTAGNRDIKFLIQINAMTKAHMGRERRKIEKHKVCPLLPDIMW